MLPDEPRLPPEIERMIFENTVLSLCDGYPLSTGPALLALLLVAKRVHIWSEPLIYRTLHFHDANLTSEGLVKAAAKKPAAFLTQHVRRIVLHMHSEIQYDSADEYEEEEHAQEAREQAQLDAALNSTIETVLSRCTGAEALCVDVSTFVPVLLNMRPTHYAGFISEPFEDFDAPWALHNISSPFFSRLSSVCMVDEITINQPIDIFATLAALPALTHLCVCLRKPLPIAESAISRILRTCRQLKVLVLLRLSDYGLSTKGEVPAALRDPRLVICPRTGSWTEVILWQPQGRLWEEAEELLARKRRGDIAEDVYWMQSQDL